MSPDSPPMPGALGRYQVLGVLGEGGMGFVYRGWDPELERAVALKRVHPGRAADRRAAERLRGEARALARLDHPAIARVFDVVTERREPGSDADERLWIVLELVDGQPMSAHVRQRTVGLRERLDWLRQVAQGLAAAHEAGILHLDLKDENVLVTPKGRAKILDFGLARRLDELGDPSGREDPFGPPERGDPDRSGDGGRRRIVGTMRAIAPELVLGQTAGVRSDLFSFGVLLYETLVGVSPFRGASRRETLQRVLAHRPPSLLELDPAMARPVSDLAAALLAKDWEGRPPDADAVVEVLDRVLGPVGPLAALEAETPAPRRAESPAPEAAAFEAAPEAGALEAAGSEALRGEGGPSETIFPGEPTLAADPSPSARPDAPPAPSRPPRFGARTWTLAVALLLSSSVAAFLSHADWPPLGGEPAASPWGVASTAERREIVEARDQLRTARSLEQLRQLEDRLARIDTRSPIGLEALLLRTRALRRIFALGRETGALERAHGVAARARSLAPGSREPIIAELEVALEGRSLDRAEQLLDELTSSRPGDLRLLRLRAWWLRLGGRTEEAARLLRRRVELAPTPELLYEVALLEVELGETSAAREHLLALLASRPDHGPGRQLLAQVELLAGRLERAATLYQELLDQREDLASLSNLGLVHLLRGHAGAAEPLFRRATELAPNHAGVWLNRADATLAVGRPAEAEELYETVLRLTERDPAEDDWQTHTVRGQALARLGRGAEARAAAERALALSDRPDVALEVAIVLAELGDDRGARRQLERALGGADGLSPVWLQLPSLARFADSFG